ncbi:MAG: ribonuclease HII [Beijerinckiaceae bacterium]
MTKIRHSARASGALLRPAVPKFPDFSREAALARRGLLHVAGVDEAGRGPLAGPVAAAAVIFSSAQIPSGLADSKLLTPARRETLYADIMASALAVSVALSPAEEIDRIDIRQATFAAMRRSLAGLCLRADYALIDGREVPHGLPCPGEAIVKGDMLSVSIAAASIVAKVTRDRLMTGLGVHFPHYGFERHAGYGTKRHRAALEDHGPCGYHRFSFAPIRKS